MTQEKSEQIGRMLQVIGNGLQGLPVKGISNEDAVSLISESRQYGIEALLYYLLKKECLSAETTKAYRNLLIENYVVQQKLGELLQQMERDGIHVVVLKGYSLAMRYPVPSCRMSCDADLLIDRNEEKAVSDYLLRNGFVLKGKRPRTGCDSQWYREDVGTIELHIALFNPLNTRCLFSPAINSIHLYGVSRDTEIGSVWMLSDTDNLLYTFLHLSKHYLIGNMTLQMIIDFWLLYRESENAHEHLSKCAEEIGQSDLLNALICFAEKYFISASTSFGTQTEDVAELIYRYLFERSGKNVYEKHLKSRITQVGKIDFVGLYLLYCWKTRIWLQNFEHYMQKLKKRIHK